MTIFGSFPFFATNSSKNLINLILLGWIFQDPDLVRAEAAIHRVAGAPQLQGRRLHLRQVRAGAAPEARPHHCWIQQQQKG
uniref:Uncharacterized protein n=1 Tax=Arundo donax TaxID=35708 RepID=A0A0A9EW97_ARUDO